MSMIVYCTEDITREDSLNSMHPMVRRWFEGKYKDLTPPQRFSLKLIHDMKNVLITAPTGSGKTMSAFLSILSNLITMAEGNQLEEKIYCIYISPLRALNNDIYKNLVGPLEQIYKGMDERIRRVGVGIRTGDTDAKERQKMLAHPPNILITTPESLAIILNSERFSKNLNEIKYVVVDELHELANNKRGVHLSLSLERMQEMVGHGFVRIGLGATLYPLDDAARFLAGYENGSERDCLIVDATWDKRIDFKVVCTVKDMINTDDSKIDNSIYRELDRTIRKNRTTLVFTNTRSGTERTVFNMAKKYRYREEDIAAHHGSLSREQRLEVEDLLKKGRYKCVVSSTSLELGIDIGDIDNVVLLGSPKSVTRAIQRIGRSGHSFNDVAHGEMIVLNRDDLVEGAVMLDAARKRHLDSFSTPKNALDVLSQHIVGMALNKVWNVDDAYNMVRCAYPYHALSREDFISTIEYLAGKHVGLENRHVYAKIWYDESEGKIGKRGSLTKLIYYMNLGTIPDEVAVDVYEGKRRIGSIEEEFLARLKEGDIFVLGGKVYEFRESKGMTCFVNRAEGKLPTIPPWFSEQLPLSYELAVQIGKFRDNLGKALSETALGKREIKKLLKNEPVSNHMADQILDSMPIDGNAKASILNYFTEQLAYARHIPSDRFIVIEKTMDSTGERELIVFHSLFGRRVNDSLSRLFAIVMGKMYDTDVGVSINDNGFVLHSANGLAFGSKDIERMIDIALRQDVEKTIKENIRRTELMKRRFRHNAARSFMILKNYKGVKISVRKQQFNAEALIESVEEIGEDFPVLKETYREIREDVMDIKRTVELLGRMRSGEIGYKVIETDIPSPFSHLIINFSHGDVVMMKDRRKRLRELHRMVMKEIKKNALGKE